MLAKSWKRVCWIGVAGLCASSLGAPAQAARYADTLGYYEPGQNVDVVYGSDPMELYNNALAALGGPGEQVVLSQGTFAEFVSLGGWSDDATTGTNDRTPGLVIGFSVEVLNTPGDDLLVIGNAPWEFTFYEPGFIEVAIESDGGGAKLNGWQDETFYLIKPGNYSQIVDPRTAPSDITITSNPDFSLNYSAPFDDDANLPGYFDVTPGGDGFDIADAIDINGNVVGLTSIAYIRLRSVSDSAFPFGSYLAPDVDHVQVLEVEGDTNGDEFVGIEDLGNILGDWNNAVPSGKLWQGDLTGDGYVGIEDLNVVLGNWNAGTPPGGVVVPEPSAVLLLAGTLCGLTLRRR